MTPRDALDCARDLIGRDDAVTIGLWPRAAALLARQALEMSLDELWARKAPGVADASTTAQLLCLPAYVEDGELAHRVALVWKSLSRACHHHAYELAPSEIELRGWLDQVEQFVEAMSAAGAAST